MRSKADQLNALSPGAFGRVPFSDLFSLLDLAVPQHGKFGSGDVTNLSTRLAAFGFGLEPDPRFSGPLVSLDSSVILFREPTPASWKSLDFLLARTEVEIAALVAAHDGKIDGTETKQILERIKVLTGLTNPDKVRLIAYLAYLVSHPPSKKAIERIAEHNLSDRQAVANAAVDIASRKGELAKTDVDFLERTFEKLKVPKKALQQKIETLKPDSGRQTDIPPLVKRGEPSRGIPIPPQQKKGDGATIALSPQKISEIRANTAKVSAILCEIFETDPEHSNEITPRVADIITSLDPYEVVAAHDSRFPGLDPRHARLLSEIWDAQVVNRDQFDAISRRHGLMASGAIAIINDWSFERFEEPLLDDGESIVIARHLVTEAHVE